MFSIGRVRHPPPMCRGGYLRPLGACVFVELIMHVCVGVSTTVSAVLGSEKGSKEVDEQPAV